MAEHLSPKEDARFQPLRARALAQWQQDHPKYVRLLKKQGELDEALDHAVSRAINILNQAADNGLAPNQGQELANEVLYLRTSQ